MEFYTNVFRSGNKLCVRGYSNGIATKDKIDFRPTLYVSSKKKNSSGEIFRTLDGQVLYEIQPGSMKDTREFVERYKGVDGFDVYGNSQYAFQYISDNYPSEIKFDKDLIKCFFVDIETTTNSGFPDVETADEEILLITLMDSKTNEIHTFGRSPYTANKDVNYHCVQNETELLLTFLKFWKENCPDIVSGWNINFFDIPYLIRRITNVLGESHANTLSPWGDITERRIHVKGNEQIMYEIAGVSILDYIDLYKKFTYSMQESYRLDHIAYVELGENKLDHSEYDSFKEFYTNGWKKFVEYNIHDTVLVFKLEEKMKLIELAIVMAYNAKVNYEDVFSQVRMWDTIIYNHLRAKKIVIPNKTSNDKDSVIEGAYVKDPIVGMHDWVVSFDLNSLYPHLIMQYNISPETLVSNYTHVGGVGYFLEHEETGGFKDLNLACSANGWCYRKDIRGFLPELMEKMYADRSKAKKQMLVIQQQYENDKSQKHLKNEISRLNNLQMALKIALNSAYGALANQYFRYYDRRMAEGITLSGQLSIRWIHNKLNDYMNKVLKTESKDYVIAVDTDSVYLNMGPLVDKIFTKDQQKDKEKVVKTIDTFCEDKMQSYIDECYVELAQRQNAYDQKMIMKRESIADKGIFVAKKRYVLNVHNSEGVQYSVPKMKIMGLEMIKSSTPHVVRGKLKEAMSLIISGDSIALRKFVLDYKKEFFELPVEDAAFPRSVNNLKEYSDNGTIYRKSTPIHVRGALMYNHVLKEHNLANNYPLIREGDRIKFIYLKEPNIIHEDVISFTNELPKEFGLHKYVDYEKQFEKVFVHPLESILEAIGWTLEEKNSLDEFFG
jgi:DNA polymerase elongation subunit (family B)